MNFDLLVRADYLLTLRHGREEVLRDAALGVNGNKIEFLGPWSPSLTGRKFVDAGRDALVMPGLLNCHMHLPMGLFRGLADDLPFDRWLNEYILPLEGRLVNPEFVRLGTELALAECIRAGTTFVAEMYYFDDDIAEVVDRSGLRGLIGETVYDFIAPDNKSQNANDYSILQRLTERYKGHDRVQASIATHAPYSCSDATLKKALAYARKHDLTLQIHVAETKNEFDGSMKEHGKTPVARLRDLGFLDHPSLFAHCVHLTDDDIKLMARSKATAVYNPESNMKLGAGVSPIRKMLDAGVNVALGTDGSASNNDLSLFKEMDAGTKLQKLSARNNTELTALETLRMATLGGAKGVRLEKQLGTLETGKLADFIVMNLRVPHMQPVHVLSSQLVYAANGSEVETVVVGGKLLMERRKLLTLNEDSIFDRVQEFWEQNRKFIAGSGT